MTPKVAAKKLRAAREDFAEAATYENAVEIQRAERNHQIARKEALTVIEGDLDG